MLKRMERIVASTFDGHALCVPKGTIALEMKLPVKKKMLWHQRLGHIGEKVLKNLKK